MSLNGVWRVQGVLATSRALGDYPLKDQKVIVCEPDILSFQLNKNPLCIDGFGVKFLFFRRKNNGAFLCLSGEKRGLTCSLRALSKAMYMT